MTHGVSRQVKSGADSANTSSIFDRLRELYVTACPAGYEVGESVDAFYSGEEFWEKFRGWLENSPDFYPASDKAFVESAIAIDRARVINIGIFYPWAEIEWGARAKAWVGLDNNPAVLARAQEVLRHYPDRRVRLVEANITAPLDLGERFDWVLDLSTLDQLDPRAYRTILENYKRLSDRLVMAYDTTDNALATYDFEQCGFNALMNPETMVEMLEELGYRVLDHRPFAHKPYRSYVSAML